MENLEYTQKLNSSMSKQKSQEKAQKGLCQPWQFVMQ